MLRASLRSLNGSGRRSIIRAVGITQALALQRLGHTAEARSALTSLLERHPRHRDSLMVLARLLREQGDLTGAEHMAGAAAALNPADREAAALREQLRGGR
jgi:predicted Zn-dependent protease